MHAIGSSYLPFLVSAETLDLSGFFGETNECLQRYFFYDDDDGVSSFESFRRAYERDSNWTVNEGEGYISIAGGSPSGRRIEILANVPIDAHPPANRGGKAKRSAASKPSPRCSRGAAACPV